MPSTVTPAFPALLVLTALAACSNTSEHTVPAKQPSPLVSSTPGPANPPSDRASDFNSAWSKIQKQLASDSWMSRLVDPSNGLYVLDNPGAFTILRNVARADDIPRVTLEGCAVRDASTLPTFSCESDSWSDTGCLHVPAPTMSLAEVARSQIKFVEGREPTADDEQQLERVRQVEKLITDAVFFEGTVLYFGRVGEVWRLIAVDVVTPCSA